MKLGNKEIKQIKIVFDVEKQRYDTVGDYEETNDEIIIKILKLSTAAQVAVAIHELVEVILCKLTGIDLQAIDKFDIEYEDARSKNIKAPCGCVIQAEPGNDIHAPYYKQHQIATKFEYEILCQIAKDLYNKEIEQS